MRRRRLPTPTPPAAGRRAATRSPASSGFRTTRHQVASRSAGSGSRRYSDGRAAMRVLHLTTEFPPIIYGGLGTAVGGWVTGSARSGVDVAVLLVEGPLA